MIQLGDEPPDEGGGLGGVEFSLGREDAVGRVDADLFNGLFFVVGGLFCRAREIEAGDLQTVEEETGAARVDGVGGDAVENLAYGLLDGGAVFGLREMEGGVRTQESGLA